MNKLQRYINEFYRIVTAVSIALAAWKLIRHYYAGLAKKTGHAIDSSLCAAGEKYDNDPVKYVDKVATNTKKTFKKAAIHAHRALNNTK